MALDGTLKAVVATELGLHAGRYCAPDPDGSIEEGYSGGEVVQVRSS